MLLLFMVTRMNGLIYRHISFRGRVSLTYVAQTSLTENVLKLAHGTFMAGHQVIRKTQMGWLLLIFV